LTKPATCLRVPRNASTPDALAGKLGALQTTWPVLSSGQYGALILFSTCILSWAILRAQSYGVSGAAEPAQKITLVSLSNPSSVLLLSQESAVASAIFLFAFAWEYFPLFASTERTWNADDFTFYALLFFAMTFGSLTKVKDASMLNRLQTEEWKGWMQWLFIMYHYCAAASIYNVIRVFICAYVWMTGYGNFIYFTTTSNFCLGRFIHMMWRLNFAVLMLMLVMNKSWIVYYICPLHTFYFCMTFLVAFIYKQGMPQLLVCASSCQLLHIVPTLLVFYGSLLTLLAIQGNGCDLILRAKILATFLVITLVWDARYSVYSLYQ
jgi:hypothetical protein